MELPLCLAFKAPPNFLRIFAYGYTYGDGEQSRARLEETATCTASNFRLKALAAFVRLCSTGDHGFQHKGRA